MEIEEVWIVNPFPETFRANTVFSVSVSQAFERLIDALEKQAENGDMQIGTFGGIPGGSDWRYRLNREDNTVIKHQLPYGAAGALNELYYAFCRELRAHYETGLSDGTDLLRRLATGEITMADVNAVRFKED